MGRLKLFAMRILFEVKHSLHCCWLLLTGNEEKLIQQSYSGYIEENGIRRELSSDEAKALIEENRAFIKSSMDEAFDSNRKK